MKARQGLFKVGHTGLRVPQLIDTCPVVSVSSGYRLRIYQESTLVHQWGGDSKTASHSQMGAGPIEHTVHSSGPGWHSVIEQGERWLKLSRRISSGAYACATLSCSRWAAPSRQVSCCSRDRQSA